MAVMCQRYLEISSFGRLWHDTQYLICSRNIAWRLIAVVLCIPSFQSFTPTEDAMSPEVIPGPSWSEATAVE
jgi:hypothetical protein